MLIDEGRTSRIAVVDRGGFGFEVAVGVAVDDCVGALGGEAVAVALACAPSVVVPQAARALTSRSAQSGAAARLIRAQPSVSME